jgi:hypothetical protein
MATKMVTLNYNGQYGYLEYDEEAKKFSVHLEGQPEAEKAVLDFLAKPLTLSVPKDECTYHFEKRTVNAADNWEDAKLVLGRLWENTEVLVEWSMPPKMAENL